MAKFTQQHYEAVARVLFTGKPEMERVKQMATPAAASTAYQAMHRQWIDTIDEFTDYFQGDNPKFKSKLFRDACNGVGPCMR
jgi:hypothetical protein